MIFSPIFGQFCSLILKHVVRRQCLQGVCERCHQSPYEPPPLVPRAGSMMTSLPMRSHAPPRSLSLSGCKMEAISVSPLEAITLIFIATFPSACVLDHTHTHKDVLVPPSPPLPLRRCCLLFSSSSSSLNKRTLLESTVNTYLIFEEKTTYFSP